MKLPYKIKVTSDDRYAIRKMCKSEQETLRQTFMHGSITLRTDSIEAYRQAYYR